MKNTQLNRINGNRIKAGVRRALPTTMLTLALLLATLFGGPFAFRSASAVQPPWNQGGDVVTELGVLGTKDAFDLSFITDLDGSGGEVARFLASNGFLGIGTASPSSLLDVAGNLELSVDSSIFIDEKAAADAYVAGQGQLWVDDAAPNVLKFTDDAGTDFNVSDDIAVLQLAGGTDGELITWDDAGAPATVAVGTDGQFLMSNGVGLPPSFEDLPTSEWKELGETTLTSAASTVTVSSLAASEELRIVVHVVGPSTSFDSKIRFNNDSGSNYDYKARRVTTNKIYNYSTGTSQAEMKLTVSNSRTSDALYTVQVVNRASYDKLAVIDGMNGGRYESFISQGSWNNTSDQIDRVDLITGSADTFGVGTRVIVYGRN